MRFLIQKSKLIIKSLCLVTFFTITQSKAQSVTSNNDHLLSLSIICPDSAQCIYSGQKLFPITTKIINNSNQNLEIPLEAIEYLLTTTDLKNAKTGKVIPVSFRPCMPMPELLKKLTVIPAHGELMTTADYAKSYFKYIFNKGRTNQIAFYQTTVTPVYFEGSKEPMGYYKDGKFEPKLFKLKAARVITKK